MTTHSLSISIQWWPLLATLTTAPTSGLPIANQQKEDKLLDKSGSRNGLAYNYKHQV